MRTGSYGIKYNVYNDAIFFIENKGMTMEIVLNKSDLKKLIRLLEAVHMDKLIGGEE